MFFLSISDFSEKISFSETKKFNLKYEREIFFYNISLHVLYQTSKRHMIQYFFFSWLFLKSAVLLISNNQKDTFFLIRDLILLSLHCLTYDLLLGVICEIFVFTGTILEILHTFEMIESYKIVL